MYGAKKRYAGLIYYKNGNEELEIVGLEAVRGDWTDAARQALGETVARLVVHIVFCISRITGQAFAVLCYYES